MHKRIHWILPLLAVETQSWFMPFSILGIALLKRVLQASCTMDSYGMILYTKRGMLVILKAKPFGDFSEHKCLAWKWIPCCIFCMWILQWPWIPAICGVMCGRNENLQINLEPIFCCQCLGQGRLIHASCWNLYLKGQAVLWGITSHIRERVWQNVFLNFL